MDEQLPTSLPDVDVFLEHYGIKGMKWGIRRSWQERSASRARRKKDADDFKKVKKLRKKKVSQLTNDELKFITNRLNLEQNFERLNPGRIDRGKKHVDKFVALGATYGGVHALYKSPHGQAAIVVGKKILTKGIRKSIKP